jgi:hypothetical protein
VVRESQRSVERILPAKRATQPTTVEAWVLEVPVEDGLQPFQVIGAVGEDAHAVVALHHLPREPVAMHATRQQRRTEHCGSWPGQRTYVVEDHLF